MSFHSPAHTKHKHSPPPGSFPSSLGRVLCPFPAHAPPLPPHLGRHRMVLFVSLPFPYCRANVCLKVYFYLLTMNHKKVWPCFWSFLCLYVLTGRFGDSRINSYDAFLELAWGKVPVTFRTRVLLQWPWWPPARTSPSPFPDFPVSRSPHYCDPWRECGTPSEG